MTKKINKQLLRTIPSVTAMLEHEEVCDWLTSLPRRSVVDAVQTAIQTTREAVISGKITDTIDINDLLALTEEVLVERTLPSLSKVINATGIVLHTGLGRAPLCEAAIESIVEGVSGYCNLEYELDTGQRGKRNSHVRELLTSLTGAESATVVNNNAAATLLILQVLAAGKEVIVSRGQLIEIGGSFRLPEIMSASGAILREVGTTNRTRLSDYAKAINDQTAALLRVHPSNYRVMGFTEETPIDEIAQLAHEHDLIVIDDLGSGALLNFTEYQLPPEPCVRDSLSAGADIACFSGDKLMGGPQCGIIVGKKILIDQIEHSPLMRTYRVGKLTLLALEATLRCYLDPDDALENIPTLQQLTETTESLGLRAQQLVSQLESALVGEHFYVCSDVAFAGGGSLPTKELETVVVQWRPEHSSTDKIAAALRDVDIPVVVRIRDDAICFDLRTIPESDFDNLVASVSATTWEDEDE